MQQFRSSYRFWASSALFLALLLGLTACGGDGGSNGGGSGTFKLPIVQLGTSSTTTLTTLSLNNTDVFGLEAFVYDSGNNRQSTTATWSSSDTTLLSLAADGTRCGGSTTSNNMCVCAGKWDPTFVECAAPDHSGIATITVKAGSLTTTLPVYVHSKVARVTVSTPVTDCTSSTGTVQATANAFDAGGNPVTVGPSDQTGFSFQTSDGNIVTTDTKGLLTAVNPGAANIYAISNNVVSTPVAFSTCAVKKINLHLKDSTDTSFTVDTGTAKSVVAEVIDTKDKTITIANSKLSFSSANNGIVTVDSAGSVATPGPGTSAIVAACIAPNCNSGLPAVFSNPVVANVNGTSSTQVIVLSSASTSLFPIDTSTGTVGSAVTLPANPNSIVFARTGLGAYVGSASSLIAYDNTKAAAVAIGNLPGKVIAVSNNGGELVVFENATNKVTLVSYNGTSASAFAQFVVAGIPNPCETTDQCPRAGFTPDSSRAYVVAGGNLYVASPSSALRTIPLGQTAKDVAVSEQGSFVYVANGNNSVDVFATCNNTKLGSNSVAVSAVPQRIVSSMDATKIYAVTPPSLSVISPSSDFTGCPPSLNNPLTSFDMGQGNFTTKQLLVTSNGAKVIAITDTKIFIFNTADNSTAAVTLAGGATPTTGDVTLDGKLLYVGGSDSKVHKIDLATNSDAAQIAVTINPEFVVVKTK